MGGNLKNLLIAQSLNITGESWVNNHPHELKVGLVLRIDYLIPSSTNGVG